MLASMSSSLILYDTEVGDDSLKSLAAGLPHGLTNLTLILSDAMNLRSAKVGDDGLKSPAAGLPHGLTSLNLNLKDTKAAASRRGGGRGGASEERTPSHLEGPCRRAAAWPDQFEFEPEGHHGRRLPPW